MAPKTLPRAIYEIWLWSCIGLRVAVLQRRPTCAEGVLAGSPIPALISVVEFLAVNNGIPHFLDSSAHASTFSGHVGSRNGSLAKPPGFASLRMMLPHYYHSGILCWAYHVQHCNRKNAGRASLLGREVSALFEGLGVAGLWQYTTLVLRQLIIVLLRKAHS